MAAEVAAAGAALPGAGFLPAGAGAGAATYGGMGRDGEIRGDMGRHGEIGTATYGGYRKL